MFIFFAAFNVWFRMSNIRDNRQALKHERFFETGAEVNKDIIPLKKTFTDSRCSGRLSDSSNCFWRLQTLIPWSPPRLFSVSGIHQERNHSFTRSTRPITVHKRTAICKSQLEPIIENPGNTPGADQAFGRWFAAGLYRGLVRLQRRLWWNINVNGNAVQKELKFNPNSLFKTNIEC